MYVTLGPVKQDSKKQELVSLNLLVFSLFLFLSSYFLFSFFFCDGGLFVLFCFKIIFLGSEEMVQWLGDCSSRRPEFGSQHLHWVSHYHQ